MLSLCILAATQKRVFKDVGSSVRTLNRSGRTSFVVYSPIFIDPIESPALLRAALPDMDHPHVSV